MPCVFCYSKQEALPFSPDPPMVSAVLADRDAPCHHLVALGRRTLSLPLRLLRPNHRQKQQLERPYPPANQQPPRQAVARSPAFANQLHPHVTAAAAWTFHAKHTLSFVDLHPCTPPLQSLFRHFVLRALNVSKSRPFHAIGMGRRLSSEKRIRYIRIRSWMYFFGGDTALLPVHCCAIFSGFSSESGTCGANSRSKSSSVGKISFTILTMFSQKSSR